MTNLLSEFLAVGLLGRIDDDVVLDKIDRAVKTLAQSLSVTSRTIIRTLMKEMRMGSVPVFHALHRRFAFEG